MYGEWVLEYIGGIRRRELGERVEGNVRAGWRGMAATRLVTAAVWQFSVANADWTCSLDVGALRGMSGLDHAVFVEGCKGNDGLFCSVECEAGYYATTTWTSDGKRDALWCHCESATVCPWRLPPGAIGIGCQPVECPADQPTPHAQPCEKAAYTQLCTVGCAAGYVASPGTSGHYTCAATGTWEDGNLECTANSDYCTNNPADANVVLGAGCTLRSVDSVCTAECAPGYERAGGQAVYKCGADGTWKPEAKALQCEQRCANKSPVPHSTLQPGCNRALRIGQCAARCDSGYTADGNALYTCGMDARWTGGHLTCTLSGCSESLPPVVPHAERCPSAPVNGTCVGACSAGYTAHGSASYTCTGQVRKHGQWNLASGSLACKAIPGWCTRALPAGFGVDLSHCDQVEGSRCEAKCGNGTSRVHGLAEYVCGADVDRRPEWAPVVEKDPLICEKVCSDVAPAAHAQFLHGCDFLPTRRCLAKCATSFIQVGGGASYSCTNGTWQDGSLECVRPCHPGSERTKNNSTGSSTRCAPCGEFQFSAHGEQCTECPEPNANRTRCIRCAAGLGPSVEQTVCEECRTDQNLVSVRGVCRPNNPIANVHDWVQRVWDNSSDGQKAAEVVALMLCSVLLLCACAGLCGRCCREGKSQERLAAVLRASFLGGSEKLPGAKLTSLDVQARWVKAEAEGHGSVGGGSISESAGGERISDRGAIRRYKKDTSTGMHVMFTSEHMRELRPSSWKQEPVGFGSYGTVYKATWRGRDVAVKVLKLPERTSGASKAADAALRKKIEEITKDFVTEVEICADLHHPNLVRLLGYADRPSLILVHELLRGKSIDQQLYIENWKPSHRQVLLAGLDVARGMEYLHTKFLAEDNMHDQPIIHRDLKTPNLLLVEPPQPGTEQLHVKIADFGLSRDKGLDEVNYTQTVLMTGCGSVLWMAPEILLGQKYNETVDVYSYAMCLVEMVDRQLPWAGISTGAQVPTKVTSGARPELQLSKCEAGLRDLIRQCWSHFPHERPQFVEIVSVIEEMLELRTRSSGRGRRTSDSRSSRRVPNPVASVESSCLLTVEEGSE